MRSGRNTLVCLAVLCVLLAILYCDEKNYFTELTFSKKSGFYEEPFELELHAPMGTEIYYTLDSSEPNEDAIKYTEPILIGDATDNDNTYSMRTDVTAGFLIENSPYAIPKYNIDKCTVIRAVYRDADGHFSDVETESYFVGYGDKPGYDGLNVISVVTPPDNLFDYDAGIYVLGHSYDEYMHTDGVESLSSFPYWWWHEANYHNYGLEWERPASIQIFNVNKRLMLNVNCGIRIQGGGSRGLLPKNLNIYARELYNQNGRFYLDLFDTGYMADTITLFAGSDDSISKLRDKLAAEVLKDRAFATMNFVPYVMFLDGEYWGVYWLTEKYDDAFLGYYYNVGKDNVIMIKGAALAEGEGEDYELYADLREYMQNTDLTLQNNYEYACRLIDMQSFIDYYAAEIYIARYNDWPIGNEALWRTREIKDGAYEDGRWRWMLYDVNSGGISSDLIDVDTLQNTMANSDMFYNLCQNEDFKRQFITTFMDIANTCFNKDRVNSCISDYLNLMTEPSAVHLKRFRGTKDNDQFLDAVADIQNFFDNRRQYIVQYLKEDFGLNGSLAMVEIEVNDTAAGSITVNTATITLNDNAKWSGEYYTDYPIVITASANEGYRFVCWEQNGISLNSKNMQIDLDKRGVQIKAIFEKLIP